MAGKKIEQIREALRACFESATKPLTKLEAFEWIFEHYGALDFNRNTLTAQLYRSCVNTISAPGSSAPKILFYEKSSKTYRLANEQERADYLTLQPQGTSLQRNVSAEDEPEVATTFALESHLRDYLAKNLTVLEKGLTLWTENPRSIEYSIEGRRIDILARDVEGTPVVIELKLSRGHEATLGQSLYYRAKLKQHLTHRR